MKEQSGRKKKMNKLEQAIKNLKEYIEIDRRYRGTRDNSDFDKFCENHCNDIEIILKEIEKE